MVDLANIRHSIEREFYDPELWLRLEPAIRKRIQERVEDLARGRLPSFEAYREAVGFLNGMAEVLEMARELSRNDSPHPHRHED